MSDDPALIWDQHRPARPRSSVDPERPDDSAEEPALEGRIDLKEASRRFGVSTSTLGAWARKKSIDGVMAPGAGGRKWMVTPESVAHHLASRAPDPTPPRGRTAPTDDGSAMLVPRDAWDRLMEQLGNLHEAGLHLAEARERAARAETEAEFLRERLGEIRAERDQLKDHATVPEGDPGMPSMWDQVRRWLRGTRR